MLVLNKNNLKCKNVYLFSINLDDSLSNLVFMHMYIFVLNWQTFFSFLLSVNLQQLWNLMIQVKVHVLEIKISIQTSISIKNALTLVLH